ncbi:hypothetical protein FRC01_003012 [Tulasnella sp. 417]|nr:hypothetical protein FRC01_003012 [Tulasnella sp. 417]
MQTLPRTVEAKNSPQQSGVIQGYGTEEANPVTQASQPPTAWQLLSDPLVRRLVLASFAMASLGLGFDTLFVLFTYTPMGFGGLGRQLPGLSHERPFLRRMTTPPLRRSE